MEEQRLLSVLKENCKANEKTLIEMMKVLDLTILGDEIQEQQFKDIYNRVLSENTFVCAKEFKRETGFKVGDRILDESMMFLLSEEDFDKVGKLALPYFVEEKLTDESGRYITNWSMKVVEEKNNVFAFICKKILPKELGDFFYERRWNIVVQDKVINATRKSIVA